MVRKFFFILAVLVPVTVLFVWIFLPQSVDPGDGDVELTVAGESVREPGPAQEAAPPLEEVEERKVAEMGAVFASDGFTRLRATAKNTTDSEQSVSFPVGSVFESGENVILSLEAIEADLLPGQSFDQEVRAVALRSSNVKSESIYIPAGVSVPQVKPVVAAVRAGREAEQSIVQLAVLVAMENPPLSGLADFATVDGDLPVFEDFSAFRTGLPEMLEALRFLKDSGVDIGKFRLAASEQLRLEAMVRPATRPLAKRVFDITDQGEWAFWTDTLSHGDPRMRHYALYGIGRFYPATAVRMMPEWVDNGNLRSGYRLAAVYSLGMTGLPEAILVLESMERRYPSGSLIGVAVRESLEFLRSTAGN